MRMRMPCLALLGLAASLVTAQAPASSAPSTTPMTTAELNRFYEQEWQRWLREDPTLATSVGDSRYDDRWPDLSLPAIEAAQAADRAALATLERVPVDSLREADRLTYDIVHLEFERRVALQRFKPYLYAISHMGSLQSAGNVQTANEITEIAPFASAADYEHWIARLASFGRFADQVQALLALGIREGRTQPRVIMERVRPQLAAQRVAQPEDSPFYAPFKHFPDGIGASERERLAAAARSAIANTVLPAFARFQTFFEGTYLPACRESVGLSATPDGAAYYRELIAYHTTLRLSPEEIHAIGEKEVARIRGEMERIRTEVGFQGSSEEFAHFLRTDPRFFYKDPGDLLHAYMVIAKGIDPNLVKLFHKLPRTPYGVRPVPATSAPNTTTAYYQPLAPDGSRPGYFYVNLYKPEERPKWEMEVLTAHEAVPGHHLQLALQFENAGAMPMIRRLADFTAYVEGWGLYAESLGSEVGLYQDPYQRFGQLTYDMWRAVRLVVDTGMHAQGWTRQQAIDYFKANAPKSELDITNEIDRYLAMPGQALAYKMGQLKILELRTAAQQTLGQRFDIRDFHDTVLASGAVPLPVLDRLVRRWIASRAEAAPAPHARSTETRAASP